MKFESHRDCIIQELHSVVNMVEGRIIMYGNRYLRVLNQKEMKHKVGIKSWPQLDSNLSLNLTNVLFPILLKKGNQMHFTISWDRKQCTCMLLILGYVTLLPSVIM